MVVLDGERFYDNMLAALAAKVSIGNWSLSQFQGLTLDQNRIVFTLPVGVEGNVTITRYFQDGDEIGDESLTWPEPLVANMVPDAVNQCGSDNPQASGLDGNTAFDMGPYAASYTDVHAPDSETRVYYPAHCGGLRTPPAYGLFPFVLLLHGDGCGHINYEFMAQHLASWGFMSASPPTEDGALLIQVLNTGLNTPENWLPALAGHAYGEKTVIMGHSRGSERTEFMMIDNNETRVHGVIFLGPVNQGYVLGVPSLMLSATKDLQAFPSSVHSLWASQTTPRYYAEILGGNHSQFTDDKHWEGTFGGFFDDGYATIPRNRQLMLVQALSLAFIQKMFLQTELFPHWLTNPGLPAELSFETAQ